jgi:hypothetical protein
VVVIRYPKPIGEECSCLDGKMKAVGVAAIDDWTLREGIFRADTHALYFM